MVTRQLLAAAGLKVDEGHGGAVTLIQRFGSAANLNIHLHCLVLDGVYRCGADGTPAFVEVDAPSDDELHALLQSVITRLLKMLTRRGVLVEDMGQTYLAEPDADGEDVFVRGTDSDVWHTYSSGGDWSGWHSHLGKGTLQSYPGAVVFPGGDVHVFAQGDDRNIWHTFWDGSVWSGWRADLGSGILSGKPLALLDSHGWLHVFAQGDDRNIWHSFWNGQVWRG